MTLSDLINLMLLIISIFVKLLLKFFCRNGVPPILFLLVGACVVIESDALELEMASFSNSLAFLIFLKTMDVNEFQL
jgi:hypothetical protein